MVEKEVAWKGERRNQATSNQKTVVRRSFGFVNFSGLKVNRPGWIVNPLERLGRESLECQAPISIPALAIAPQPTGHLWNDETDSTLGTEMWFRVSLATDRKNGFEIGNGFWEWNAGYTCKRNRMRLLTAFSSAIRMNPHLLSLRGDFG
jgi:hypothetical protein